MASLLVTCLLVLTLSLTCSLVVESGIPQPKLVIPAIYIFGDSYIDAGNNDFLPTKAKANFPPYGIDFPGGVPTGRATNGRLVVDFIAEAAGLPLPPPMLGMSEAERKRTITGVNYGSGSSGIRSAPPKAEIAFGHVLSLKEQVGLFKNTTVDLKNRFDTAESFASYFSKSLFFIHAGSNDLGLFSDLGKKSDPKTLSEELSKNLQALYQLGARNFLVNNVSPLGCVPFKRHQMPNRTCSDELNKRISAFNELLPELLASLESSLSETKFVLGDLLKLFTDVYASPDSFGFTNIDASCCIDVKRDGSGPSCAPNLGPCVDRGAHVFFDPNHPSEAMHELWARTSLEALKLIV
ncbi:hypothetical protein PTKIN_Ptkin15bG0184800 [Pterospermum kingtungense]